MPILAVAASSLAMSGGAFALATRQAAPRAADLDVRKDFAMCDEMAALPGPEYAVALLERLAAEKQPLLTA